MDSLSQITLGAAVGEAALGKKIGNKAPLLGAFLGTVPDFDVFFSRVAQGVEMLFVHRGFMHSISFALLFALGGMLLSKLPFSKRKNITARDWGLFFFLTIFTHPLLDMFTSYGTAILYPFVKTRFGWDSVFIVDPLYTIPLLVLLIVAITKKTGSKIRKKLVLLGLTISTLYLLIGVGFRQLVLSDVRQDFSTQPIESVFVSPAPFNNILWTTIVQTSDQFIIENRHVFKSSVQGTLTIDKPSDIPVEVINDPLTHRLQDFARGQGVLVRKDDTVLLYDLRFASPIFITDQSELFGGFVLARLDENDEWQMDFEQARRFVETVDGVWDRFFTMLF